MDAANAVFGGAVIASAVGDASMAWKAAGIGRRFQTRSSSQYVGNGPVKKVLKIMHHLQVFCQAPI